MTSLSWRRSAAPSTGPRDENRGRPGPWRPTTRYTTPSPPPPPAPHTTPDRPLYPGLLTMLPAAHLVPSDSQCRKSLTGNPWSHPCVISSVSPSSNLVTCLPITSFSTVPFEEKAKSWGWARRYLPIQHDGDGKLDRHLCGLKPLPLAGNQAQLKRQSFVNLETEFSIEAQLLLPLANGDICIDIDALRRELASFRGEQRPRARPARTDSDSGYETSSNKSDRSVSSERAPESKPAGARCRTQEGAPEISAPAWRMRSSSPTKKRDFGGNWRRRN